MSTLLRSCGTQEREGFEAALSPERRRHLIQVIALFCKPAAARFFIAADSWSKSALIDELLVLMVPILQGCCRNRSFENVIETICTREMDLLRVKQINQFCEIQVAPDRLFRVRRRDKVGMFSKQGVAPIGI